MYNEETHHFIRAALYIETAKNNKDFYQMLR